MNKMLIALLIPTYAYSMQGGPSFKEGAPRKLSIESDISTALTENDENAAKILVRDYFTDTDDLEQYVCRKLKEHSDSPTERERARSLKRKISSRHALPDEDIVYAYDVLLLSMKEAYSHQKKESKSKISKKAAIAFAGVVGSALTLATAIVTFYSASCDQ